MKEESETIIRNMCVRMKKEEEQRVQLLSDVEKTKDLLMERFFKQAEEIKEERMENSRLNKRVEIMETELWQRKVKFCEVRSAVQEAGVRADAAEKEVENFKRKRAASTSPPPPQIKLLVRPQAVATHQSASPPPCQNGVSIFSAAIKQKIQDKKGSLGQCTSHDCQRTPHKC
jgi:hypothetical protein